MADDYYRTLGVSRDADAAAIRKAYKKLAKENHPDRNPDDPAALERYKKAGEAYATLSDAEKRSAYDRFGSNYKQFGGGRPGGGGSPFGGGGGNPFGGGGPVDVGDLFGGGSFDLEDLLGGLGGRGPAGGPAGGPGAGGRRPFGRRTSGPARRGADVRTTVTVPFHTAVRGGEYELDLTRAGARESVTVKIPPGLPPGGTMRLAGKGEPGAAGPGDLLLTVNAAPHPVFRRDGQNLLMDLPLTPAEAALGAKVDVPTLSDGTVTLTIPPGTGGGAKLRLRGKGAPGRAGGADGDQIVQTKIVVPKEPTDRQRALYEQLKELDADVRAGAW